MQHYITQVRPFQMSQSLLRLIKIAPLSLLWACGNEGLEQSTASSASPTESQVAVLGQTVTSKALVSPSGTGIAYYVSAAGNDANLGTSPATAWKSLSKVSSVSYKPGDAILFRCNDVFAGSWDVKQVARAASTEPIYIGDYVDAAHCPDAATRSKPLLNGNNNSGTNQLSYIIRIKDSSYVHVSNLTITNNNSAYIPPVGSTAVPVVHGILVQNTGIGNMAGFKFQDLSVNEVAPYDYKDIGFDQQLTSGIAIFSDVLSTGISDVSIRNSEFLGNARFGAIAVTKASWNGALSKTDNTAITDVVFADNYCNNNGGSCFMGRKVLNMLVTKNTILNTGTQRTQDISTNDVEKIGRGSGAWFTGCVHVVVSRNYVAVTQGGGDSSNVHIDGGNEDVLIQNNRYYGATGPGLEILGGNNHIIYRYNYSVNDGARNSPSAVCGVIYESAFVPPPVGSQYKKSNDIWIYNNAFLINDPSVNVPHQSKSITLTGTNIHLINNIFARFDGKTIDTFLSDNADTPVNRFNPDTSEFKTNLYYNFPVFTNPLSISPLFPILNRIGAASIADPMLVNSSVSGMYFGETMESPVRLKTPTSQDFINNYRLKVGSPAINAGTTIQNPPTFNGTSAIFNNVSKNITTDIFGNLIRTNGINIGPYQGMGL